MKVGMILYSKTGNTLSVAEKIKEALTAQGHSVNLEQVTAVFDDPRNNTLFRLENKPNTAPYDHIIFAAPVQAFSLVPVMKAYLDQLPSLEGRTVTCFTTQHFPKAWMGGLHTIKQMTQALKKKGARVEETGIVNWTGKTRDEQIQDIVKRFSRL